jgi:hypothetical protein
MLPTLSEARLYLRTRGIRATLSKAGVAYVAGRLTWNVTVEDLLRWVGVPRREDGLEIRPARPEDLPRMERFWIRQPQETLQRWLGSTFFFFIALLGQDPISYRCLSRLVAHPAVAGALQLRPDQLFMVDEFTSPPYRRQGITRQLAIATNPLVLAEGYRQVIGLHHADNADTVAATRAKGIPTVGTLTRYRVGPASWLTYSPRETATARDITLARGLGGAWHRQGQA